MRHVASLAVPLLVIASCGEPSAPEDASPAGTYVVSGLGELEAKFKAKEEEVLTKVTMDVVKARAAREEPRPDRRIEEMAVVKDALDQLRLAQLALRPDGTCTWVEFPVDSDHGNLSGTWKVSGHTITVVTNAVNSRLERAQRSQDEWAGTREGDTIRLTRLSSIPFQTLADLGGGIVLQRGHL